MWTQEELGDQMTANRWQTFRSSDDSIPTTPYEAGVFVQNARLYLMTFGYSEIDARLILCAAHDRINASWFDVKEVA